MTLKKGKETRLDVAFISGPSNKTGDWRDLKHMTRLFPRHMHEFLSCMGWESEELSWKSLNSRSKSPTGFHRWGDKDLPQFQLNVREGNILGGGHQRLKLILNQNCNLELTQLGWGNVLWKERKKERKKLPGERYHGLEPLWSIHHDNKHIIKTADKQSIITTEDNQGKTRYKDRQK